MLQAGPGAVGQISLEAGWHSLLLFCFVETYTSMVDIQSATADNRQGKKRKKEETTE